MEIIGINDLTDTKTLAHLLSMTQRKEYLIEIFLTTKLL